MNYLKSIFRNTCIWVFVALIAGCTTITQTQFSEKKAAQYPVNNTVTEDVETSQLIKPYKDSLDKIMHRVLGKSSQRMEKGQPESLLGNFVSDLVLDYINQRPCPHKENCYIADMAFFNNGGFRNSLPEGNVSVQNVYELMPFDNEVVILTMPGTKVNRLLQFIAKNGGIPVGGLRMKIKNNFPQDVYIANAKFDSTKTYRVATSDYLANGGDNLFFLSDKDVKRETLNLKIRDLLLNHIPVKTQKEGTLKAKKDGRITVVE